MPERIRLSRAAGWRKPEGAVSVGRPSDFGNPFRVGDELSLPLDGGQAWLEVVITPEVAVACFRSWLAADEQADLVGLVKLQLAGRDLACWCPLDQLCHADVLLEIANEHGY